MHIAKEEIPVKIDAPGAVARQLPDFGKADGAIGAEYFTLNAGTDLAPLLAGLDGDMCHSAHWGYMITGEVVVSYRDGSTSDAVGGDVFHWPAGHSVRIDATPSDPVQPPRRARRGNGPHPQRARLDVRHAGSHRSSITTTSGRCVARAGLSSSLTHRQPSRYRRHRGGRLGGGDWVEGHRCRGWVWASEREGPNVVHRSRAVVKGFAVGLGLRHGDGAVPPATPAHADEEFSGSLPNGTQWIAAVPDDWNGILLLHSHGYTPSFVPFPNPHPRSTPLSPVTSLLRSNCWTSATPWSHPPTRTRVGPCQRRRRPA